MNRIDAAVVEKLRAQRGQEEAVALWSRIWAAYESGGAEAVESLLASLLEGALEPSGGGRPSRRDLA